MLPYFLMVYSIDYVERVFLLADAAFVSDCGKISNRKMYLRKNNKEYYVFTLNNSFLLSILISLKVVANE